MTRFQPIHGWHVYFRGIRAMYPYLRRAEYPWGRFAAAVESLRFCWRWPS